MDMLDKATNKRESRVYLVPPPPSQGQVDCRKADATPRIWLSPYHELAAAKSQGSEILKDFYCKGFPLQTKKLWEETTYEGGEGYGER